MKILTLYVYLLFISRAGGCDYQRTGGSSTAFIYISCAGEESPVSYIAYVVSAYSLTIVCVNVVPLIRRVRGGFRRSRLSADFSGIRL